MGSIILGWEVSEIVGIDEQEAVDYLSEELQTNRKASPACTLVGRLDLRTGEEPKPLKPHEWKGTPVSSVG